MQQLIRLVFYFPIPFSLLFTLYLDNFSFMFMLYYPCDKGKVEVLNCLKTFPQNFFLLCFLCVLFFFGEKTKCSKIFLAFFHEGQDGEFLTTSGIVALCHKQSHILRVNLAIHELILSNLIVYFVVTYSQSYKT